MVPDFHRLMIPKIVEISQLTPMFDNVVGYKLTYDCIISAIILHHYSTLRLLLLINKKVFKTRGLCAGFPLAWLATECLIGGGLAFCGRWPGFPCGLSGEDRCPGGGGHRSRRPNVKEESITR